MFNKTTLATAISALIALTMIQSPLVNAQEDQTEGELGAGPTPLCDKNVYGTPNIEDCKTAMTWIPYIDLPRGFKRNEATAFRTFAEPHFMTPPFSLVKNEWAPKAIQQLPKIWKHSRHWNFWAIPVVVY